MELRRTKIFRESVLEIAINKLKEMDLDWNPYKKVCSEKRPYYLINEIKYNLDKMNKPIRLEKRWIYTKADVNNTGWVDVNDYMYRTDIAAYIITKDVYTELNRDDIGWVYKKAQSYGSGGPKLHTSFTIEAFIITEHDIKQLIREKKLNKILNY